MARFYVLDTREQADAAVDAINARARYIYRVQGYTLEGDGDVIGHRASDGTPQDDATKTETWDIPRQRLDGKWVVAHAETCPGNAFPIDAKGTTVAMFVGQDLLKLPVETEDSTWWPTPEPLAEIHTFDVGSELSNETDIYTGYNQFNTADSENQSTDTSADETPQEE